MKQRPRFPERKKREDGTYGCRGCGGEIPKNRKTWCSRECVRKFDPFYVKHQVFLRAGGKCDFCGKDCSKKAQHDYSKTAPAQPRYSEDCGLEYPYRTELLYAHPLYREYVVARKEWKNRFPKPEYDHIIPHCEGGEYVIENIRLLCRSCHIKRTSAWRKSRKSSVAIPVDVDNLVT